ncbi:septal ring lytic transglycosylase RlpA family protein [Synechococcus sp. CC9311]|uniref:septal ring lytic transglycosylase RlpA family protein n=1 Tax=Synechococcus sp. (strain CC9311) TaxID=64471 RepID=UPI0000DDAAE8|nr:septal ring lytic transglycosylase RlpA family protein [Synechococcus sp. CC9311]ABI47021.1 possible rare lipoprotein A [Synechococcus sp. CC9311]
MHRSFPFASLATGLFATGCALFPVLARDVATTEFYDPFEPLVPESVQASTPTAPAVAPPPIEVPPNPPKTMVVSTSTGEASWYGPGFFGNRTANGEVFRPGTMTAAHRTLPFGTKVKVTNLRNGKETIVRINDRGPFSGHRVIDIAHGAAHHLGLVSSGIAQVRLEVLR